ncbi:MAG: bifunctional diaminohydroxyphosphoribosylaminopyrimidine deaminase/5-amino-6-(5-phosphoribosylamino)uracil reductase RibD [Actinomycetota bacterium]
MNQALMLAERGPIGVNPQVGCVVLDATGLTVGMGWHQGAGTPHAEVMALADAGDRARGGTAVVTLEPCAHRGRTGPCVEALRNAGVTYVLYGHPDRNPVAAGGARWLREHGISAELIDDPVVRETATQLLAGWQRARELGRPLVTWKFAASLDGRSAAADLTSQWLTGLDAREDVHRWRSQYDTILVGTGTAIADDPQLTVRDTSGVALPQQPLRAVMGMRELPPGQLTQAGATLLRTRDPHQALAQLWELDRRHVWLEGGPTLAAAFWRAALVDRIIAYVAPVLLGAGVPAVAELGIGTLADAARLTLIDVQRLGADVRFVLEPQWDGA